MSHRTTILLFVSTACLLSVGGYAADKPRLVYPQAVVGRMQNEAFEIELRLGNRNNLAGWTGSIRLLRQQDLQGMADVRFTNRSGQESIESGGEHPVTLPPGGSEIYSITSETLQIGVLVIESETAAMGDLNPSFFYRLHSLVAGSVTDLIAIQPSGEPGLAFHAMIADTDSFEVGLAVVSQRGLSGPDNEALPVDITLTATLEDGTQLSAGTTLGAGEYGQKALFPSELIEGLPPSLKVAQLRIAGSEPIYCAVLGVGTPPDFQDIQIGATPALADSGVLFSEDAEHSSDLWTPGGTWSEATSSFHSGDHSWFAQAPGAVSDQRLTLKDPVTIPAGLPVWLSFWHRYSFERFDGGVVELSIDGGSTWADAGTWMIILPYDATLPDPSFQNPLANRDAFSGGDPNDARFQQTIIDLSSFAGEQILLRFRVGSDESLGGGGWYVDDIEIRTDAGVRKTTLFDDDLEEGLANWATADVQEPAWSPGCGARPHSGSHCFTAKSGSSTPLVEFLTLVSPVPIPANAVSATLSFWHWYALLRGWNGGIVEISFDDGLTWTDAGSLMIRNGYDGMMDVGLDNPLAGRAAFTGEGTNTWMRTEIDVTSFAGKSLRVRFGYGQEGFNSPPGWNVDDVAIEIVTSTDELPATSNSFYLLHR